MVPSILENIRAPLFRDATYDITDYGARAGLAYNSLPAITEAINRYSLEGAEKCLLIKGSGYLTVLWQPG